MRKSLRTLSTIALLTGLGGCATTEETTLLPDGINRVDQLYVSRVEDIARKQGTRVVWVNKPSRQQQKVATR